MNCKIGDLNIAGDGENGDICCYTDGDVLLLTNSSRRLLAAILLLLTLMGLLNTLSLLSRYSNSRKLLIPAFRTWLKVSSTQYFCPFFLIKLALYVPLMVDSWLIVSYYTWLEWLLIILMDANWLFYSLTLFARLKLRLNAFYSLFLSFSKLSSLFDIRFCFFYFSDYLFDCIFYLSNRFFCHFIDFNLELFTLFHHLFIFLSPFCYFLCFLNVGSMNYNFVVGWSLLLSWLTKLWFL